ncbi:putative enoyl-CoA hydratase [Caenibius tardaugens NBRC 16725]|uniref:Putative enoyl-CoA hydratase n=1 Tax=Caenibius tardaugens NBRC 16725 TaxID=1219035 RepID=U3A0E5_9SPHN|nr:enoyl-CoA hydratase-related protein [Caenibius tardaugens]AZI35511.1 hypothetical protein EGO55_05670 [Caenibius tardaugens NBRC 16725]GAD51119.1 putative enoyl-CoA hydratase [Caenibius tardaugens NBRC 16725]
MENFTIQIDADGIALITFDVPGRSLNAISAAVQQELDTITARIRDDDAIRGAIFHSGKERGFCAGADLTELPNDIARWRQAENPEDIAIRVADAARFSGRIRALETCGKPVVAAISGITLGGGLELALGCHFRIAVDDDTLRLGLPEVTLGLLPGAGGTQRLLRLMGLSGALPHIADGTMIDTEAALAAGVIHKLVPAEDLLTEARQWILDGGNPVAPWDQDGFRLPGGGPHSQVGYTVFSAQLAARRGSTGEPALAVSNILKTLYEGSQVPIEAGLRIESRYFYKTACSDEALAGIQAFLNRKK